MYEAIDQLRDYPIIPGMAERKCWYEARAEKTGVPFISIKNNGLSTLVFNPNLYEEGGLTMAAEMLQGSSLVTKKLLEKICSDCNLCRPEIEREGNDGFRIYRYSYEGFEDKKMPLTEFHYLLPKGESRGLKVAFVDDFDPSRWAQILVLDGFEMLCVGVDANVRASESAARELGRKIIEWGPDWLISDKGLGFVDGIELIKQCKEAGIRTVMLTGEIQTAETRKVADYFFN